MSALEISIEGLPSSYRVYEWSVTQHNPQEARYKSDRFSRITVNIPDDYVVRNSSREVDVISSLEKWRTSTPRGPGHPYTASNNIARFPFYTTSDEYTSDSSLPVTGRPINYISLSHILERVQDNPELRFNAHNCEPVAVTMPGVIGNLRRIKDSGGPVDCTKSTGLGSVGPWTTEECLLCNCANEAGIKNNQGKIAVTRTLLRRVVSKHFPNSVCEATLFKQRGSDGVIRAAFSWTYGNNKYQTHHTMPSRDPGSRRVLNDCVDTTIQAINMGPSRYDHYYNPAAASPGWGNRYSDRERIGQHIFLRKLATDSSYQHLLDAEMRGTGGERIQRPISGFCVQQGSETEGEDVQR